MQRVCVAYRICNILNGQFGHLQELCGFDHPVLDQELLRSPAQRLAEDGAEVAAVQSALGSDVLHGYIILKILLDKGEGFPDIKVLDFSTFSHLEGSHGPGQVIEK